jgi:hypothetical protein
MLAFFKSWQNNGTTLFASIEHSKAIKGPKDFKFTLLILSAFLLSSSLASSFWCVGLSQNTL